MHRAIVLPVGFIILLSACTQRMICPAYQSAFIHDQPSLSRSVSMFENDSTPKVFTVSKDRYLIIPEQSYRKKIRSMQTVQMRTIRPVVPDSLAEKKDNAITGAEQDSTATAPDSLKKKTEEDSVYQITKDKEVRVLKYKMDSMKYYIDNIKYTSDQDNYMWYFRDVLILPDVRAALEQEGNAKADKASGGKGAKAKKGGFFKNLFSKHKSDSAAAKTKTVSAGAESDSVVTAPPKKKKFGLFRKDKKQDKVDTPPAQKDPAKKEDDGF